MHQSGQTLTLIMFHLQEPIQIYSSAQAAHLKLIEKQMYRSGQTAIRFYLTFLESVQVDLSAQAAQINLVDNKCIGVGNCHTFYFTSSKAGSILFYRSKRPNKAD